MVIKQSANKLVVYQSNQQYFIYGVVCITGTLALLLILAVTQQSDFATTLTNLAFGVVGVALLNLAESRTTTFTSNGNITIVYRRMLGGRVWTRRFSTSQVVSIRYIRSFDNQQKLGRWHRISSIYLITTFQQDIEIGSRQGGRITSLGIRSNPHLDIEAKQIANFTKRPLTTISNIAPLEAVENIHPSNDRMTVLFNRPSQAELDAETTADNSAQN